ncbi:DUF996 domain-containing protein [Thermococcus sp.]|uniref:DUF996 domain-containing protein n=1 Tax=Thermococcus sp. TaxID=35749 RepID=UPI0025EBB5BB|nr:DUF996 domain-containing protein [Thermococcus sp.]
MAELKDAKVWGGIGAILTLVGLGFVGFILKLVGVKRISDATGNGEIFSKYLWAAVLAIIASVLMLAAMLSGMSSGHMLGIGMVAVVAAIIMIVAAYFMKQSYDLVARETGVKMFSTVALLYIIGAILTVIMIGVFIILIAAILEIVAFFSLPDSTPESSASTPAEEEVVF